MKRIALHTLGCKLNYAETAAIGKQFVNSGYSVVDIDEPADVIVINSCSVTSHAERECRQIVRRVLRHSPQAFVAVAGCYAQLEPNQIAQMEGVDLVVGSQEKNSLVHLIHDGIKKSKTEVLVSCVDTHGFSSASSAGFEDRTRVFLKVQDGCDYTCSYCTIPRARGKSRSTNVAEIIRQAREAVDLGYKELVLTGVNVGDYGHDQAINLLTLLKQLTTIDGLMRIRISSIEPNLLTDELLEYWISNDKLCNHWHIPLQSGSDTILRQMRRRYLTKVYIDRIMKIKSSLPQAGVGSDVIVGFPGETDVFFEETYSLLQDLPVSYFHIFTYSERPETPAIQYPDKVQPHVKSQRSKRLHELGIQKRQLFYQSFVGKTIPVLFETEHKDNTFSGLTEEYVRVEVQSQIQLTNSIESVFIQKIKGDTCIGKMTYPVVRP